MSDRPQKITFAEMRDSGVRGLLAYCADYRCSHSIAASDDGWPDEDVSSARPAVSAALMCGQISTGKGSRLR